MGNRLTGRNNVKIMSLHNACFPARKSPIIGITLVVIASVALLLSGCANAPPRGKLEQKLDADSSTLGNRQLGFLVGDYANTFADAVKLSASKIETRTTELPPRRAALQWKIRAIPAVYTVASHEHPFFGLADLWVLAIQQRDLFDRDDMSQIFGAGQPIAQATSRLLEERIESIARRTLSPNGFATLETFVRGFAAEHTIVDLSFVRDSLAPFYIDFMAEQTGLRQQLTAATGYAETALALALVGLNHVPEIARWQAELTLLDAESYPVVSRTVESMDALGAAAVDLKAVAADLPVAIDEQREAILRDIERQRIDTLRDIDDMRVAAFADVAREREALLAGFDDQIQALLYAVRQERELVMSELPEVAELAGEAVLPVTREVIDHAFWRAMQLSALLVAFAVAAIFILRMTRRRGGQ